MANHFNFEKTLNDLLRLDAPIQRGPMMRWQRKAHEAGLRLAVPAEQQGNSPRRSLSVPRTPGRTPSTPLSAALMTKTPSKTPKPILPLQTSKTPNKTATSKTPLRGQRAEDRFIPNRRSTDIDLGHHAIMRQENDQPNQTTKAYQQELCEALGKGSNPLDSKILSFNQKVQVREGHQSNLRVLYSTSKSMAAKTPAYRYVPQEPDRILDAPCLLNDYYLNLMDWSSSNHLVVGLGDTVFLWDARDGSTYELCETSDEDVYVTSVSFIKEGNIVAVGTSSGHVELWDIEQKKLVRSMAGHAARVSSLAWNSHIISSGARSGAIHHHDVRVPRHHVASLLNHEQEVCGLSWSPDGRYLASGGNDNLVNIWDASLAEHMTPLHQFTHHQAAVKALAWCPWQPHILATGGGTNDRRIRFWNAIMGSSLNSVDANSQVCALLWSTEHREIITGHGYSKNQLILWKYPSMKIVSELHGHTSRILALAMSPDQTMVMSAAADETIRLWKCFMSEPSVKTFSKKTGSQGGSLGMMHRAIR